MALTGMAAWILGAAAVAGAATAGGVVLYTSGPLANDNGPPEQAVETPGAQATPTPPPTPTVVPTPPVVLPEPPTPAVLDAEGWPVVACPPASAQLRVSTRRITACGPLGWEAHQDEMDGSPGRPPGFYAFSLDWQSPDGGGETIQLSGIEKRSEGVARDGIRPQFCAEWTPTVLLGLPAEQCLITIERQGDQPLFPGYGWQLYVFAETGEYWLLAEAAGPEVAPASRAAIERALQALDSVQANGLGRVN